MNDVPYVHGYSNKEYRRLSDQANTLSRLLHHDSVFRPAGLVLAGSRLRDRGADGDCGAAKYAV